MGKRPTGCPGSLAQLGSLVVLAGRYTTTMHPLVEREIERWTGRAQQIPDPHRRALALAKLRETATHARLNATAAALAPRRHRADAVRASVALELAYDYLDGLTERESDLPTALSLYSDLSVPFAQGERDAIGDEYVRDLVHACRTSFRALPSHATAAPLALSIADRTAATQAWGHASSHEQLARWAVAFPRPDALAWWEAAAGWTAGSITLHALIALAATDALAPGTAERVAAAYERISAIATLADSLVDQQRDARSEAHSYVGYYASADVAGARIGTLAGDAVKAVTGLPHAAHHALTLSGIVAYYLTDPDAATAAVPVGPVKQELGLVLAALMLSFRVLRRLRGPLFPPW